MASGMRTYMTGSVRRGSVTFRWAGGVRLLHLGGEVGAIGRYALAVHRVVDEGAHLGNVVAAICRGSRFVIGLERRSRELQRASGRISCCGVRVTVVDRGVVEVRLAVTDNHHPGFPVRAGYWIG